jgi:hypothetical protein
VKLATLAAALLICGAAAAHDIGQIPANPDPKTSSWFRSAKSPAGTSCCDEVDGFREGAAVRVAQDEPAVFFGRGGLPLTAITLAYSTRGISRRPNSSGTVRSFATIPRLVPLFGCRGKMEFC